MHAGVPVVYQQAVGVERVLELHWRTHCVGNGTVCCSTKITASSAVLDAQAVVTRLRVVQVLPHLENLRQQKVLLVISDVA